MSRIVPLLACALLLAVGPRYTSAAEPPDPPEHASPEVLAGWIEQLSSDSYLVRERAMQKLMRADVAALDGLAAAADGNNLEAASRAVRILLELSESDDPERSLAVLKRIAGLKNRPVERAAAEAILQGVREEFATAEIKRLGGVAQEQRLVADGQTAVVSLQIGESWRGGDEGLRHVADLKSLQVLTVHGTPVTDKGIAHLHGATSLHHIQLYGTMATEEGVAALQKNLPNAEIHFRSGAKLGVAGIAHPRGAQVTLVEPESAAESVGIEAGDVITKFNGQAVRDMEHLTTFIAKYRPGDKATIDWQRDGEEFNREVVFGKWR